MKNYTLAFCVACAALALPHAARAAEEAVRQPVLVDSNDKVVGPIVGVNSVLLSYADVVFLAPFDRFGFEIDKDKNHSGLNQDPTIYYFSNDCSGDAYLKAGPIPPVAAKVGNQFVFPGQQIQHNMSQSNRKGPNGPCRTETVFDDFGPRMAKAISRFGFAPPFTAVLK